MKVLVTHGKHGDLYYDASTPEALHAAALDIVAGNIDYFYLRILEERQDYQYEDWDIVDVWQAE